MNSSADRTRLWAAAILGLAAVGLSYDVSRFAIDFGIYYAITYKVFINGYPPYGPDVEGMVWPMYYRYPPPFLFLVRPFVLLPFGAAAFVWALLKSGVLAWAVRDLIRAFGWTGSAVNALAALCIAGPYVFMEFRYGNVQFLAFALVAWVLLYSRERPLLASLVLGLAITIKVWPLFFVPYLAASREWRVAARALPVVVVLLLLPAAYFGWDGNLALLDEWRLQEEAIVANAAEIWFPSQSLHGVMTRYLSAVAYDHFPDPNYPRVNLASLTGESVHMIWCVVACAGYGLLLWLARSRRLAFRAEVDGIAFCALVLLQPYSQKQSALVVLLWPALAAVSGRLERLPVWGRVCLGCAAALGMVQVLLPSGNWHRLFQVLGTDALLTSLLAAALLSAVLAGRAASRPTKGGESGAGAKTAGSDNPSRGVTG